MIKLALLCWLCLAISAQSAFLKEEELHRLKKGDAWILSNDTLRINLSYDIWRNRYSLFNASMNWSSSELDSLFLMLRNRMNIKYLYIEKKNKKKGKSKVLIVDWFKKAVDRFRKRKIVLYHD